jgi:hypothetical protein
LEGQETFPPVKNLDLRYINFILNSYSWESALPR